MKKYSLFICITLLSITFNHAKGQAFVTKWTVAEGTSIAISQTSRGYGEYITNGYKFKVDWGDNSEIKEYDASSFNDEKIKHTYTSGKDYIVTITGTFPGISFENQQSLKTVIAWGDNRWKSMNGMFAKCKSLKTFEAKDKPILDNCKDMSSMFYRATSFNDNISSWNTGNVTKMFGMFDGASSFNQDISSWNTGNVTEMASMFNKATSFNQDISSWNTGMVTNMAGMFSRATLFNQDISSWDTKKVKYIQIMFLEATSFSQDLTSWNTKLPVGVAGKNFAQNSGLKCSQVPSKITNSGCK